MTFGLMGAAFEGEGGTRLLDVASQGGDVFAAQRLLDQKAA